MPGMGLRMNREVTAAILERLGKPWSLVRSVPDRPGHDVRYAMDGAKLAALGWQPHRDHSSAASTKRSSGSVPTRRGGARRSRATGRPTTNASTGGGWLSRWRRDRRVARWPADRGDRCAGPAGPGTHAGTAVRPVAGQSPGAGPTTTWTTPPPRPGCMRRDLPRMIIHARRGPTSTAVRGSPSWRSGAMPMRPGSWPAQRAPRHIPLVLVSTNEVFDGERTDGQGYAEGDEVRPANPYGASKLAGERAALAAYADAGAQEKLWIVRSAWLFGPPGADFPAKILAAADRLPADHPLRVVTDEVGLAHLHARPGRRHPGPRRTCPRGRLPPGRARRCVALRRRAGGAGALPSRPLARADQQPRVLAGIEPPAVGRPRFRSRRRTRRPATALARGPGRVPLSAVLSERSRQFA